MMGSRGAGVETRRASAPDQRENRRSDSGCALGTHHGAECGFLLAMSWRNRGPLLAVPVEQNVDFPGPRCGEIVGPLLAAPLERITTLAPPSLRKVFSQDQGSAASSSVDRSSVAESNTSAKVWCTGVRECWRTRAHPHQRLISRTPIFETTSAS